MGIIISAMTGWSIANGAIVGGIFGIFYVILAGMKEIGWVNLVNAVVIYIGLILSTIFIALKLPGGDFSTVEMERGDTLIIRTLGGGGYGDPLKREPDLVLGDVLNGLVHWSPRRAITA